MTAQQLLRTHVAWGVRPGARVVLRTAVAGAGADVDAFERYLLDRGGRRVDAGEAAARSYWVVPDALFRP